MDCPEPIDIATYEDLAQGRRHWVCGCGQCPTPPPPDPTPAELQGRVDAAAWQRDSTAE